MQDTYALTESQRELAGKNHNLIYKFAKIKEADLEEFYGVLAIGLCKAARAYDASSGYKFSTLAYRCMDNEYKMYWRGELSSRHIPSNMIVSYNKMMEDNDGKSAEFLGIISNRLDSCSLDYSRVETLEFFRSLSDIQKIVLNGLMYGYRDTELAEYTGFTRSYIGKVKRDIRRRAAKKWSI